MSLNGRVIRENKRLRATLSPPIMLLVITCFFFYEAKMYQQQYIINTWCASLAKRRDAVIIANQEFCFSSETNPCSEFKSSIQKKWARSSAYSHSNSRNKLGLHFENKNKYHQKNRVPLND